MNHVTIIGNLTADPITRTTQAGKQVVTFTVAVNRRQSAQAGQPEADFFRVSAWSQLGEICAKYLSKGRKCAVTGSVRAGAYTNSQGKAVGTLEVMAENVEFLTPKGDHGENTGYGGFAPPAANQCDTASGFVQVEDDELPF